MMLKIEKKIINNVVLFVILGGWPPNNSGSQYRQYPPQGPQQWPPNQGPRPQPPNQWADQNRYPVNQQYGPVRS